MYVRDGKRHNHLIQKNKGAYENSFDRLFDFNRDGSLDPAEQGFQLDFITEDIERDNEYDDEKSDDYSDLDWDELEDMDEDERREALEEAGYDPDDFDDDF